MSFKYFTIPLTDLADLVLEIKKDMSLIDSIIIAIARGNADGIPILEKAFKESQNRMDSYANRGKKGAEKRYSDKPKPEPETPKKPKVEREKRIKFPIPTFVEARIYANGQGIGGNTVLEWFQYRERQEWTDKGGKRIVNWKNDLHQWNKRNKDKQGSNDFILPKPDIKPAEDDNEGDY